MARSSLSISYYAFTALHFACFALAITVCGLYGADLQRTKNFDNYTKSKWVRYRYLILVSHGDGVIEWWSDDDGVMEQNNMYCVLHVLSSRSLGVLQQSLGILALSPSLRNSSKRNWPQLTLLSPRSMPSW
jgi:hypothetical protein